MLARRSLTRTLALQERILARAPHDHVLYISARRDVVVTLVALGEFARAERESATLQAEGPLPDYVLEARADALAGLGRVDEASVIYQQLATPARAKDKRLLEKRFYAYSDGERYGAAQGLLAGWQEPPTRWDFTGNMRMANDDYEKVLQLKTLLQAWRGEAGAAERQLEGWLKTAPANPWLWLQLGISAAGGVILMKPSRPISRLCAGCLQDAPCWPSPAASTPGSTRVTGRARRRPCAPLAT